MRRDRPGGARVMVMLFALGSAYLAGCHAAPAPGERSILRQPGAWLEAADRHRVEADTAAWIRLQKRVTHRFQEVSIEDALRWIEREGEVDIEPEWESLEANGIGPQLPVSTRVQDGRLEDLLNRTLRSASERLEPAADLRWEVRDGRVCVRGVGWEAPAPPTSLYDAYRLLAESDRFTGMSEGFAATIPVEVLAFAQVLESPKADAVFEDLFHRGTPTGQLWALCGLYHTDRPRFESLLARYRDRGEQVAFTQGCVTTHMPIARIIADGGLAPFTTDPRPQGWLTSSAGTIRAAD